MLRNKCFSYSKIFMIESISSIWRGKSLIINFVMNRILQVIYIPKSIPRYLLICRHNSCSEMLECFVLEEEENLLYTYCAYEPSDVSVVLLRISLTLGEISDLTLVGWKLLIRHSRAHALYLCIGHTNHFRYHKNILSSLKLINFLRVKKLK